MIASVAAFLIYFGILREENDIDENMYKPLFETVPHLEVPMLEAAIRDYQQLGRSTVELEKRLQELRHQETIKQIMETKGKSDKQ